MPTFLRVGIYFLKNMSFCDYWASGSGYNLISINASCIMLSSLDNVPGPVKLTNSILESSNWYMLKKPGSDPTSKKLIHLTGANTPLNLDKPLEEK